MKKCILLNSNLDSIIGFFDSARTSLSTSVATNTTTTVYTFTATKEIIANIHGWVAFNYEAGAGYYLYILVNGLTYFQDSAINNNTKGFQFTKKLSVGDEITIQVRHTVAATHSVTTYLAKNF